MGSPSVITDFVSTSTAKKIFQISHSQNLRKSVKSVSGDQIVHMDSIFKKSLHELIGVSHGVNSKCAGNFRPWSIKKFAKRASQTSLGGREGPQAVMKAQMEISISTRMAEIWPSELLTA